MNKNSKAIIHVNRAVIAKNAKDGGNRPVFTTKRLGKTVYSRGVKINGEVRLIQSDKPLSCGARVWIETFDDIEFVDEMSYEEALVSLS